MTKVHILTQCEHCEGQAYLPVGEAESTTGEKYTCCQACPQCHGSGVQTQWISLCEVADFLDRATAMAPDYAELARQQPVGQYQATMCLVT